MTDKKQMPHHRIYPVDGRPPTCKACGKPIGRFVGRWVHTR